MAVRVRSLLSLAMAAALAFAVPGPLTAGAAAAPAASAIVGSALARFPAFAALADSRGAATPVALQGRLRDLTGASLGGAQVLVAAWPSPAAIAALPPGGRFDVVPLARTTAAKDGSYVLRSVLTPLLAALAGKDGLDIEINVFHGGRHYVYLSQVALNPLDGNWAGAVVAGTVGAALSGREGSPGVLDILLDPAQGELLNTRLHTSSWPPPTSPGEEPFSKRDKIAGTGCLSYRLIGEPRRAYTTVATGVVRNGARLNTTYAKGASTSASTGFSFDHGASFSVSGSRSRSASFTANFVPTQSRPGLSVAKEYRVQFLHYTSRRVCRGENFNDYRVHYLTSPGSSTVGGRDIPSRYPTWECDKDDKKKTVRTKYTSFETENERAATYQSAFGFAPLTGSLFQGNAQSGYSEKVKLLFTFSSSFGGWACGHTNIPGADGQRITAFERDVR